MPSLRDYQGELLERARGELKVQPAVCVQLPTGGGKTGTATEAHRLATERGHHSMFIVHRQELVDQTARTFDEFGVPYGFIAAGYPVNPYQPVQICSIDTLKARLARGVALPKPALISWDECHHCAAEGWQKVFQHFKEAKHLGWTATPERLDGKGLHPMFTALVCGPSTAELIGAGWLSPYRLFCPVVPDTSGLPAARGEYVRAAVDHLMSRPGVVGKIVETYLEHGRRLDGTLRKAIGFAHSVEASQRYVAAMNAAGIRAAHLDGNTARVERRATIQLYRAGLIDVLWSVDLFGEGFDVPEAEIAILARPTKSLALFLQQCGRVLRPGEGKVATILDHAGNVFHISGKPKHGLPDARREWSLFGRKKQSGAAPAEDELFLCPSCKLAHAPAPKCPACGHVYPLRKARPSGEGRYVLQVEEIGLKEYTGAGRRPEVAAPAALQLATSEDEVRAFAHDKGMRDPEHFAKTYWAAKTAADWTPLT